MSYASRLIIHGHGAEQMTRPDLTVMGCGIFGLACGYVAAQRGAKVRLYEARHIGAGSSGGIVGALAPHVPENWNEKKAFQLESLLMAPDFWSGVEALGGQASGYARPGRLQPLADDHAVELARARGENAKTLWQGQAEWRVRPLEGKGWEPASPTGLVVEDTLTGRLHPRMAARALAAALRALGAEIIEGVALPPEDTSGPVLWATGYQGLLDLNAALGGKPGGGVKGQAVLLRYPAAHLPQLFVDGLHIVAHADDTVAIGSTSEHSWDAPDSCDAQADTLYARAIAACPELAQAEVLERWAGIRPRAKSRAPMLGAWPERPGHFIANGGFKIGFGMAPKVAEVMADLILEGQDHIPEGFRVAASLK